MFDCQNNSNSLYCKATLLCRKTIGFDVLTISKTKTAKRSSKWTKAIENLSNRWKTVHLKLMIELFLPINLFSTMEKLCQLWKKCKKEVKKSAIEIEITTLEKASARRIDRNAEASAELRPEVKWKQLTNEADRLMQNLLGKHRRGKLEKVK